MPAAPDSPWKRHSAWDCEFIRKLQSLGTMYWVTVASHSFKNIEIRKKAAQAVDEAKDGDEIEDRLRSWLSGGGKGEMPDDEDLATKFRELLKAEASRALIFKGGADGSYLARLLDSASMTAPTEVSPTPEAVTQLLGAMLGNVILSRWRYLKTQAAQPSAAASSSSSSNLDDGLREQIHGVDADLEWMKLDGVTDIERRIPWRKSSQATRFAKELIDAELEPLNAIVVDDSGSERKTTDHGVMLLRTRTSLFKEEKRLPNHYSRHCMREIWDLLATGENLDTIIIGAPGSGKSRSIVYGLKILFAAGRTVVVELRRDKNVFAFVPQQRGARKDYQAWRCALSRFRDEECAALYDEKAYYIIDAAANESVSRPGTAAAQRIMVSSPEPSNYENLEKESAIRMYSSPWTLPELCAMHEFWSGPEMSKPDRAELLRRYFIIGGIPRFIFSHALRFNNAHTALITLARNLSEDKARLVLKGEVGADEIGAQKVFSSKLVTFFATSPFTSRTDFVSKYAKAIGVYRAYEILMDGRKGLSDDDYFESASLGLLASSCRLHVARLRNRLTRSAPSLVFETIDLYRGECQPLVAVDQKAFVSMALNLETVAQIGKKPAPLLVPSVGNQPAVDAADARDRFYQVTRASVHRIKCSGIKPLYTDANGVKRKVKLIFIVHPSSNLARAQDFVGTLAEKREAEEYVEQYVAKSFRRRASWMLQ